MAQDLNFPTKYRPTTFSEVVGQPVAVQVLKNIAQSKEIPVRSIFLKGSWGSGKSTLARIFSRALNCSKFKETGDVCNECAECQEALAKNSQTYYELDASVAGNIDSVKALREKLAYLPPRGLKRLVVLDECHSASSSALNALLKLIEDGVPSTIFLFASTEDILSTIKSRSICLDITTIPHAIMAPRVAEVAEKEGIKITPEQISTICTKSQGHMRDALSILQLFSIAGPVALKTSYNLIQKFIISALKKDRETAKATISEILSYPVTDIATSISNLLIQACSADSKLYTLTQKGITPKLFNYFYTPVARQALKTEAGTELLLYDLLEKLAPNV